MTLVRSSTQMASFTPWTVRISAPLREAHGAFESAWSAVGLPWHSCLFPRLPPRTAVEAQAAPLVDVGRVPRRTRSLQ